MSAHRSDGSGTRKPENPTRPEGFLLTRTRPEPEKNITNPTRPEPEKLQTRPKTRRVLFLQKFEQNCPFLVRIWVFFWKIFLADQFYSMLPIFFVVFKSKIIFFWWSERVWEKFAIFTLKMAFLYAKIKPETRPEPE